MLPRWALRLAVAAGMVAAGRGEDWPCYRKDARRSAVTAEPLAFPLATSWVHRAAAPRPAWPEPGRTVNWFDFDYAGQPVAAGGLVYFGSSADDTVYALKAADGQVAWTFTADAPVRVAPHIADGRCYFAADDGVVYCLDAQTGAPLWTHRSFARNRMVSGNGRMMSRWPCRSGVLVLDGVVYGTAGMWPSEGTAFFALDARTGKAIWCNDTANADYQLYPHDGLSFGGPTPQGDLLSDGKVLLVPAGQSAPAGFDLKTGELLYWESRAPGSTWAALGDGFVMVASRAWQGDQDTRLGEADLWESDGLSFYDTRDGRRAPPAKWSRYDKIPGTPRFGRTRMRGMVEPIGGRDRAVLAGQVLYTSGMGVIEAVDGTTDELKLRWRRPAPRVYSLALAGNSLLAGVDGGVLALNAADGKTLWAAPVSGQVRGLAVADERLIASTDLGVIQCFGRQPGPMAPPAPAAPLAGRLPDGLALAPGLKGYGLVCGAPDTAAAEALAAASELNVVCLLPDTNAVAAARKRLLGRGYGTRVVAHAAAPDGSLPYADFFANVVLAFGGGRGVRPAELYRVLQPCTGKLYFPGADAGGLDAWIKAAAVPAKELARGAGVPFVARGPLEGAFDWNSTAKADARLQWPLELLWFGGPGRDRMLRRHGRWYPPPIPAHGRVFLEGESHVIAVDAYNGTELWSWYMPGFRSIYADDEHVYVNNGQLLQCDARSGRILKIYGNAKPFVFDLDQPRAFDAKKGNKYSGRITVAKTAQGLELLLEAKTPTPHSADCWMLFFDFRETADRLLPPGRGAFSVIVNTTPATLRRHAQPDGTVLPALTLERVPGADGALTLRLLSAEVARVAGRAAPNFDLRAELQLFEAGNESPRRWLREMPLTGTQGFLQNGPGARDFLLNGTATFVLDGDRSEKVSPVSALVRADRKEAPAGADEWGRLPYFVRHDGNIPRAPVAPDINPALGSRTNPFDGSETEQVYRRGYGCSGTISSECMDFFRSGTLGMYDLAEDSGMRNFPGMKPGCGVSLLPALGLLISGEANADCFCPYSFATSLALAPAAARRNEDWALFYDAPKPTGVRHVALNLGAPGDRRDDRRTLWLGYPRAPLMEDIAGAEKRPHTFGMPLAMSLFDGGRSARVNADRTAIEGAASPWIYASQILGLRSLNLGLVYYDPKKACLAFPAGGPVAVDARLDEPTWAEDPGVPIRTAGAKSALPNAGLRLRCDAENLYLAYRETPPAGAGAPAWKKGPTEDQGNLWAGDHISVILKDEEGPACAQFGVSVGGARYSADASWRLRVPPAAAITVDGKAEDWGAGGAVLPLPESRGVVRAAWTPKGLVTLSLLPKEFFSAQKEWHALRTQVVGADRKRILETVALPDEGKAEALQPTFNSGKGESVDLDDWETFRAARKADLPLAVAVTETQTVVEALFPWETLGIKPVPGATCGLKLVAFNHTATDLNIALGGGARRDIVRGEMLLALELAAGAETAAVKAGGTRRDFYGSVLLFELPPRPIPTASWSAAAAADQDSFRSEIAIPRKLLSSLGLSLDRVVVAIRPNGRAMPAYASLAPLLSSAYHLDVAPAADRAGTYTVRLHFAELADARPGERVFGVRLQGRTVEEALDVVKAAGGPRKALVRTYAGVKAGNVLALELVPQAKNPDRTSMPILSGLELVADQER